MSRGEKVLREFAVEPLGDTTYALPVSPSKVQWLGATHVRGGDVIVAAWWYLRDEFGTQLMTIDELIDEFVAGKQLVTDGQVVLHHQVSTPVIGQHPMPETVHPLAMLKFQGEVTYVFGSWSE